MNRKRVTHQHTGPQIAGTAPFMFSRDLPADELTRIDRYAAVLKQKLIDALNGFLHKGRVENLYLAKLLLS